MLRLSSLRTQVLQHFNLPPESTKSSTSSSRLIKLQQTKRLRKNISRTEVLFINILSGKISKTEQRGLLQWFKVNPKWALAIFLLSLSHSGNFNPNSLLHNSFKHFFQLMLLPLRCFARRITEVEWTVWMRLLL